MARLFFAAVFLSLSVVAANAQNTYQVFQGTAFITAQTSACDSFLKVGDFFTHIYRQKVNANDPAEAMEFVGERSVFRVLSSASNGSLQGTNSTSNAHITSASSFAPSQQGLLL